MTRQSQNAFSRAARGKRFIAVVFVAALLSVPATQAAASKLSGDYEIRKDGEAVGVERWTIEPAEDGSISTKSTGAMKPGGAAGKTSFEDLSELTMNADGSLREYQRVVSVNRLPRRMVLEYDGLNFRGRFYTGKNQVERKMKAPGQLLVVDSGVYHHLNLLVRHAVENNRLGKAIPVFVPSNFNKTTVYVDDRGADTVSLPNGKFQARRYFIDMGLYGLSAWADAKGRLIKIETPSTGIEVHLLGYQGPAAGARPPSRAAPRAIVRSEHPFSVPTPEGGDISLNALVRRPKIVSGKLPALIFLSDTGPQDALGIDPITKMDTLTGRLCDAVTESGFVVLSYDDRGVGKSGGQLASATLDTHFRDALAALDFLAARADVDPERLAVVGLGEGANIALRLASRGSSRIKAVVAMAPSPVSFTKLAQTQVRRRMEMEGLLDEDAVDRHPVILAIEASRREKKNFMVLAGRPVYLEVFRHWERLDPVADLRRARAPVLLLTFGKDQQIFPDLSGPLIQAAKAKDNTTHKFFAKLDHFLVRSHGTVGSFSDPDRVIDPGAIGYIVRWLNERL